jgi:hypothetical protein
MTEDPLSDLGIRPAARSGSSEPRRLVEVAVQRIREIVDAAEAIAAEIRAEAQSDADRYFEQRRQEAERVLAEQRRRLERVGSGLREGLGEIEAEVAGILDEALRALDLDLAAGTRPAATGTAYGDDRVSAPEPREPGEQAPPDGPSEPAMDRLTSSARASRPNLGVAYAYEPSEERPESRPERGPGRPDNAIYESALIRATQLVVRGSERSQIEDTLQAEFGLQDPAPIVDEILGR